MLKMRRFAVQTCTSPLSSRFSDFNQHLRPTSPYLMTRTLRLIKQMPLFTRVVNSKAAAVSQPQTRDNSSRLKYSASLTAVEAGVAVTISVLPCVAFYIAKAPNHFNMKFAISVALLFAASLTVCRTFLLEKKHQDRLMAEQELKDHDSMFRDVCGTAVHYKLAQAIDTAKPLALHCYHGFGANTFSWSYVYKSLAQQLHAQVTKHDMPGFGLTQRPRHTDGYSFDFNGRLGRLVMDAELVAAGVLTPSEQDSQVGPGVSLENLQCVSSKHKAGQREDEPAVSRASIEAAAASRPRQGRRLSYQPIPESSDIHTSPGDVSQHSEIEQNHVASPKIDEPTPESPVSSQSSWDSITRPGSNRWLSDKQAGLAEHAPEDKKQGPCVKRVLMGHSMGAACAAAEVIHHCQDIAGLILVAPAIISLSSQLQQQTESGPSRKQKKSQSRVVRVLVALGEAVAKRFAGLVLWLIQPVLVLFLRVLVRSRPFWVKGLSNAWHSRDGVSDELVDAYRLPQLVKGWEIGLVRFIRARVADQRRLGQILKDAYNGTVQQSQTEQLAHAVAQQNIKVLILHGVGDRLVPVSNSRRLVKLIPNAELIEFQDCGHVPQEELPKQFIQSVQSFVEQC